MSIVVSRQRKSKRRPIDRQTFLLHRLQRYNRLIHLLQLDRESRMDQLRELDEDIADVELQRQSIIDQIDQRAMPVRLRLAK